MPHWHPDEWRTAVVLSGILYFVVGEQWDESKLKAYPAGTFYSEPPRTPHYVWAKDGEVIYSDHGRGADRDDNHCAEAMTIQIAARAETVLPVATITATRSATSSAAKIASWSNLPCAQQRSILHFLPCQK
jgi:hypothetical protein